ncbi:MAG TPA: class I SAM-dependent methyltransferase [Burkholderiales bacterium]
MTSLTPAGTDSDLLDINRHFYDALWADARLIEPQRFNTWPLVSSLLTPRQRRLEVAPGLRPRLPIEGTQFIDISPSALAKLRARGGTGALGSITALPYGDAIFDLICAFDVIEHVDNDERALAELARVAAPGAALITSVPLHPAQWTGFDDFVGHRRRYEPAELMAKLARQGFAVERSAAFGMQPKSSRLVGLGMWLLLHRRERAMWWYNRVMMPLSVRFQKPLALAEGLIDTTQVAEVLLLCRRRNTH